jgi:hypothetical protein
MPCENYREALNEAAASGAAPSRELRSHLDACASCRTSFAEELQLFAAIDTGVRASANAEVPYSLLPRVHASLEDVSASQRRWTPFLIFAAASAAIVLTVFIAARPRHAINDSRVKQILSAPSQGTAETPVSHDATGAPAIVVSNGSRPTVQRRNSPPINSASSSQLEVIVPPHEREAFAQFVHAQQEQSDVVVAVVAAALGEEDKPPNMKPLLIAKLVVRPLEPFDGEATDGTEEER